MEILAMFITVSIAIKVAQWLVGLTRIVKPEWFEEEGKAKRKNDDLETEPQPAVSHFELGDAGELIEVFEKPKRIVTGEE